MQHVQISPGQICSVGIWPSLSISHVQFEDQKHPSGHRTSFWRNNDVTFASCVCWDHTIPSVSTYRVLFWLHSVESPSMVDPQWNIWYWGSKWILHTVCWSAVGCEWGTTSVYFGITYVCLIPSRLPVFAVESQYLLQYFLFLSKVSFELHIQNLQKNLCWFKIWMGFVGSILIKLWTSSIWGFL